MKLIFWKLRFSFYMWRRSDMDFKYCYGNAGAAIENNPDDIYIDGAVYYAQEEMSCWSD